VAEVARALTPQGGKWPHIESLQPHFLRPLLEGERAVEVLEIGEKASGVF
jgi:hypothetical protein